MLNGGSLKNVVFKNKDHPTVSRIGCLTIWEHFSCDQIQMLLASGLAWCSSDIGYTGIVIDSHALNFCIHHPSAETIQVSVKETTEVWVCRRPESEQQFQHLCHSVCSNRPVPS